MKKRPLLLVFSGLPGVGKTTIAHHLVARSPCVYLRIDTIEHALRDATTLDDVGPAGYVLAYALARSNLQLGMSVVADGVNPLSITRQAWRHVAASTCARLLEIEIVCSDLTEHRRRLEGRDTDHPPSTRLTWDAVLQHRYEAWTTTRLVVDSARITASDAADQIVQASLSHLAGA
jgi:predicted kinase